MTPELTTLIKLETVAETDGAKKFDDRLKQNQRTIKSVTKDLLIQERMLKKKNRSYQYVKASVAGATKEELKAILAMEKNIARMKQQDAQMGKNNKSLRLMRGGFGQIGHQVQDIAVQLQTGTDAMIVFGQQGSQIASLFGSRGAMLGAIFAVGAALYTSFKPAVDDSKDSLKSLIKETRDQAKSLGMLTAAQKEHDALKQSEILAEATENNKKLNKELLHQQALLGRAKVALEEANKMSMIYNQGQLKSTVETRAFGAAVLETENEIKRLRGGLADTNGVIDKYTKGSIEAAEAEKERLKAVMDIVDGGKEELKTMGMTERQLAVYNATQAGATIAQIATVDATYKKIEAQKAEADAIKEAEKAEKKRQDAINALVKASANQVSTIGMSRRELDLYKASLQGATQAEKDALNGLHDLIDARNDTAAVESLIKSLTEQTAVIGMTNRELDIYKAMQKGATEQDIATINTLHDLSEARRQVAEDIKLQNSVAPETQARTMGDVVSDFDSLIESQKTELDLFREHQEAKLALIQEYEQTGVDSTRDFAAMRKQIADETAAYETASRLQTLSAVAGLMSTQLSQLSSFYNQSSGLGKAMFVANQAVAAANSMISAYEAKSKAEAALAHNPPLAMAAGNMMLMSGIMSAAAIAGQTVASFEGGGMTFNGVRSGGMDGKGGRMALVHPNEKITDMEKGDHSGKPVNVNINIQAVDAKGIDELLVKRRGVITSLVRNSLNNTGARLG